MIRLAGQVWMWRASLANLLRNKRGAATAEYALLLALVVIMLMTTLQLLGQTLQERLHHIIEQLKP